MRWSTQTGTSELPVMVTVPVTFSLPIAIGPMVPMPVALTVAVEVPVAVDHLAVSTQVSLLDDVASVIAKPGSSTSATASVPGHGGLVAASAPCPSVPVSTPAVIAVTVTAATIVPLLKAILLAAPVLVDAVPFSITRLAVSRVPVPSGLALLI